MTNATFSASSAHRPSRSLSIGLWAAQILLAVAFAMAGIMKLTTARADLIAQGMGWVETVPAFLPPVIGALEALGALGLILPTALSIRPRLTVAAAGGLVMVMVLAALLHLSRGELPMIVPNLILGGLAAFVAWGRARQ